MAEYKDKTYTPGPDSTILFGDAVLGTLSACDELNRLAAENAALRESVSRYEAALERANRYGREQDIELAALRELYGAAREVSDILFRASLSSNWNTHGVAILDAHAKLATALKEPANG